MKLKILIPLAATGLAAILAVPGALAKGGDDVRRAGTCKGNSSSKIMAKHDDGRIEVEFEVDQNRNGATWRVRLKDNGKRVFRGRATTGPPSGSFSVERRIANMSGKDHIKGIAKNRASGERCVARVAI
jgi:O-acetylhomoserine/O-acetylserine sulfhydrylase-like pyridoxal-dependent enzyme